MPDQDRRSTEVDRWGVLRHPAERREGRGRFDALAESASNLASSGFFFSLCFLILAVWASNQFSAVHRFTTP